MASKSIILGWKFLNRTVGRSEQESPDQAAQSLTVPLNSPGLGSKAGPALNPGRSLSRSSGSTPMPIVLEKAISWILG